MPHSTPERQVSIVIAILQMGTMRDTGGTSLPKAIESK